MRLSSALLLTAVTVVTAAGANFNRSSKRGLVFIPNTKYPYDNQVWVENNSDLTWYYNYGAQPSPAYSNRTQDEFEFVPQLWGTSTTFYNDVKNMINGGRKITHVLGYNEPDGTTSTGGSNIDPAVAATNWISQVQPLKKLGVKLGAPAVTGAPSGLTWLKDFFKACQSQGTNCTVDFFPAHWYDQYGFESHLTELLTVFGNDTKVWVTEFACAGCSLADSQSFFKSTLQFLDSTSWIERYTWFGSFRSPYSNVGINSAMLTNDGKLTDIGSWYLGGAATNNIPTDVKLHSAGSRVAGSSWIAAVVGLVGLMVLV